ncbi:F-box/kelch-repeat protein At1g57790-like [Andrographis paniculata]|uniref:F-box/kelch-repeat protein At1g57790-like n=1 Tax=Andrographis paniculata TaxID=175694 RepID=UPI0021E93C51|nr:F-box/kelch-repeat protein At1g57790-like [Andrographis paniculata]
MPSGVKLLVFQRSFDPRSLSCSNVSKRIRIPRKQELDLPSDVLEQILSLLSSKDRARASLVSRKWRDIAYSVKRIHRPPKFVYFDFNGNIGICDLASCRSSSIPHPNRPGGNVCYAKDGWMLFHESDTGAMTFYNPHSANRIELPKIDLKFCKAAFSAPPTSTNCVVFLLHSCNTEACVNAVTWCPGDTAWTLSKYEYDHPSISSTWKIIGDYSEENPSCSSCWKSIVVRYGIFYSFNMFGDIGVFDPVRRTWGARSCKRLKSIQHMNKLRWEYFIFMAEYKGDFFLVHIRGYRPANVYKLDEVSYRWYKVKDVGGATFFSSTITSLIRDDLPHVMKNCVYFPEIVDAERHCLVYSMKLKKFYRNLEHRPYLIIRKFPDIWMDISKDPEMKERDDILKMNRKVWLSFARMHHKAFGTKLALRD